MSSVIVSELQIFNLCISGESRAIVNRFSDLIRIR